MLRSLRPAESNGEESLLTPTQKLLGCSEISLVTPGRCARARGRFAVATTISSRNESVRGNGASNDANTRDNRGCGLSRRDFLLQHTPYVVVADRHRLTAPHRGLSVEICQLAHLDRVVGFGLLLQNPRDPGDLRPYLCIQVDPTQIIDVERHLSARLQIRRLRRDVRVTAESAAAAHDGG